MPERRSGVVRDKVAVAALIVFAAAVQVHAMSADRREAARVTGNVEVYASRYRALREMLPKSGTIGYISDYPPAPLGSVGETAFYHAQYSLAPVVVDRTATHHFVVGNFLGPGADPRDYAINGLELVQDFGNGVALFRQTGDV